MEYTQIGNSVYPSVKKRKKIFFKYLKEQGAFDYFKKIFKSKEYPYPIDWYLKETPMPSYILNVLTPISPDAFNRHELERAYIKLDNIEKRWRFGILHKAKVNENIHTLILFFSCTVLLILFIMSLIGLIFGYLVWLAIPVELAIGFTFYRLISIPNQLIAWMSDYGSVSGDELYH